MRGATLRVEMGNYLSVPTYVSNSHYETDFGVYIAKVLEIVFFEILPSVGFQKNDFYNENC
jgi:hypothetical protein